MYKASSYDSVSKESSSSPKSTKSETKSKPEPPKRTSVTDGVRLVSTGNKARDGCANMLYKALALYEGSSKYYNIIKKMFYIKILYM